MSNNKHSFLVVSLGVLVSIGLVAASVYATSIGSTITTSGLIVSGNTTTTNLVITTNSQLGTVSSGTWQGTPIADAYVTSSLTISGGTINNTPIGLTTPSTGAFTTLEATGTSTLATTTISGRLGIGTTTPRTELELDNDGAILAIGTLYSGWSVPNLGAGTRMMWCPGRAAFRAGYVNGTQWDGANIGGFSVAMGDFTTAKGRASTAMGYGTTASGDYGATAMGRYTIASGESGATAMGYHTTAQAYDSLAIGRYNVGGGTTGDWIDTDPLFEIGIGTDSNHKANALTVLKNGKIGIGTANPKNKLDVGGGMVVGANYSGTNTAPSNGMLVEGKVGIGTTSPATDLHIVDPNASSTIRIGDTSKTGCLEMGNGTKLYYIYINTDGTLVATTTKPDICE